MRQGRNCRALNNTSNVLTGAVILKGINVTVDAASAVNFGACTVTGNLASTTKVPSPDSAVRHRHRNDNAECRFQQHYDDITRARRSPETLLLSATMCPSLRWPQPPSEATTTTGSLTRGLGRRCYRYSRSESVVGGALTVTANAGAAAITLNHAGDKFKGPKP